MFNIDMVNKFNVFNAISGKTLTLSITFLCRMPIYLLMLLLCISNLFSSHRSHQPNTRHEPKSNLAQLNYR